MPAPLIAAGAKVLAKPALKLIMSMIALKGAGSLAKAGGRFLTNKGLDMATNPSGGRVINMGGRALLGTGGALSSIPDTIGRVAKSAAPFALSLGGKAVQGASLGAGALAAALGESSGNVLRTPSAKRELYGNTPTDAAADLLSGIGSASGIGISGVGNALGSSMVDQAEQMRLRELEKLMRKKYMEQLDDIKSKNVTPSEASMMESLGKMTRGGR